MTGKMQSCAKAAIILTPSFTPVRNGLLQRKCACGGSPGLSGECEACSKKKRLGLQTKLKVNEPGDIYEQEADRIADQVLATPAHPGVNGTPRRIQRFSGQPTGQMDAAPASVDQALSGPGRPLEPVLRRDMEQRFGYDFSRVRVHTGPAAGQSAQNVNAHAYTVGHDIVFGHARFAPGTREGQRLLAHELVHVVQQSHVPESAGRTLTVDPIGSELERDAEQIADTVMFGWADNRTAAPLARKDIMPSWIQNGIPFLQRRVRPESVSCRTPSAAIAAITGPDPVTTITTANTRAVELLDNVIAELEGIRNAIVGGAEAAWPTISDATATALRSRFRMNPDDRAIWVNRGEGTVDVLIRRFRFVRNLLDGGGLAYTCLAPATISTPTCAGPGCTGATRAVSCEGNARIFLCAPWWGDPADDRARHLVHEAFHIYFGFIHDTGHLGNAHCYDQFVFDLNNLAVLPVYVGACP